jgi:hypothetical protein
MASLKTSLDRIDASFAAGNWYETFNQYKMLIHRCVRVGRQDTAHEMLMRGAKQFATRQDFRYVMEFAKLMFSIFDQLEKEGKPVTVSDQALVQFGGEVFFDPHGSSFELAEYYELVLEYFAEPSATIVRAAFDAFVADHRIEAACILIRKHPGMIDFQTFLTTFANHVRELEEQDSLRVFRIHLRVMVNAQKPDWADQLRLKCISEFWFEGDIMMTFLKYLLKAVKLKDVALWDHVVKVYRKLLINAADLHTLLQAARDMFLSPPPPSSSASSAAASASSSSNAANGSSSGNPRTVLGGPPDLSQLVNSVFRSLQSTAPETLSPAARRESAARAMEEMD